MPRKTASLETPFRRGEKVLMARDVPGIAEGTPGKVKLVNGLNTWIRYWVRFNDGRLIGQINQDDLVRHGQMDAWLEREADRARAAEAAAAGEIAPEEVIADADDGGNGVASLVPSLILERSKAAKARLLGG